MTELIGTRDVAAALGVSEDDVHALVRRTPGVRPRMVAGRRVWTADDVTRLREAIVARRARPSRGGRS